MQLRRAACWTWLLAMGVALLTLFATPGEVAAAPRKPSENTINIFGGIGDLSTRMLLPSLFELSQKGHLPPDFKIVLVDRLPPEKLPKRFRFFRRNARTENRGLDEMRARLTARGQDVTTPEWNEFLRHVSYVDGDVTKPNVYAQLASKNPPGQKSMYYFAVGPNLVKPVAQGLADAHLLDEGRDVKVVVEKPYGENSESAKALDDFLGKTVGHERLYRMDHYMGKDAVQAFMRLRERPAFGVLWSKGLITSVTMRAIEKVDVADRINTYKRLGAPVDMVQPHLLDIAALGAMDHPEDDSDDAYHRSKLATLESVRHHGSVQDHVIAGHYGRDGDKPGFRELAGEDFHSVPTYVGIDGRYLTVKAGGRDVPLTLETGKSLGQKKTELVLGLREIPAELAHLLPQGTKSAKLVVSVDPEPKITLEAEGHPAVRVDDIEKHEQLAAYGRQFLNALQGNRRYYATRQENVCRWGIMAPINAYFDKHPEHMVMYSPGHAGLQHLRALWGKPPVAKTAAVAHDTHAGPHVVRRPPPRPPTSVHETASRHPR